jgi:hypothetical protein
MKFWIKILSVFLFFFLIFLPKNIEARSGCCSHHGGVCGCRCCDGSSLSSTCAPYYPSCNTTIKTVIQPTSTPRPTAIPTKKPTLTPTNTPSPTNTPTLYPTEIPISEPTQTEEIYPTNQPQVLGETDTQKPTEPVKTSDTILGFSILGLIGFGIYKLFVKIKNKIKDYFNKK